MTNLEIIMKNVDGWEQFVLKTIAKRLKKIKKMTTQEVMLINNMTIVKADMNIVMTELAKTTGKNIKQLNDMYAEALQSVEKAHRAELDYRNITLPPFSENARAQTIADAWAKETGKQLINLGRTSAIGISDAAGKIAPFEKAYATVVDKAIFTVTHGGVDFNSAMRNTVLKLGGSGVKVVYGSGVSRRLDSVVRQVLMYGTKKAFTAYDEYIGDLTGCDGIEIDYHANPRPGHVFMQGRQFVTGKSKTINGELFDGTEDTYSDVNGVNVEEALDEYNCYHFSTAIICGVSPPAYRKDDLERWAKKDAELIKIGETEKTGYEWSQVMRGIETQMRKFDDQEAMLKVIGDADGVKTVSEKRKKYEALYGQISEATGIKEDKDRMQSAERFIDV